MADQIVGKIAVVDLLHTKNDGSRSERGKKRKTALAHKKEFCESRRLLRYLQKSVLSGGSQLIGVRYNIKFKISVGRSEQAIVFYPSRYVDSY